MERIVIPAFAVIILLAAAILIMPPMMQALEPAVQAVEQAISDEPVYEEVQQIEQIPIYDEVPAAETMPLVTQEALSFIEPEVEQAIEQAVDSTVQLVTPGSKFGKITLPPVDISQSHAIEEHGIQGELARRCYENPSNLMMYRERFKAAGYKFVYHILCQDKDGIWFDRLIYKIKEVWYEKTAFMPKDGSWDQVSKWLQRKGVERIRQLP